MNSSAGIIVCGSINVDLFVRTPRMPHVGETVLGGRFFTSLGGKGANQAVAAARASRGPVTFLAAVGDDPFGRDALATLAREPRLAIDTVRTVPGQPTGVALITVDQQGENMICVASGANHALRPEDFDRLPDEVWRSARMFLACLESPLDTIAHGLRRARAAGLVTILNPAPAIDGAGTRELLALVDVLTPNEIEAITLHDELALHAADVTRKSAATSSDKEAITAAQQLCAAGAGAVIVTLGAQGCAIVDARGVERIAARTATAVDTTAAGDAFSGALAAALAEGRSLVEAARFATCAAAISVTRAGAIPSLALRAEIDAAMTTD